MVCPNSLRPDDVADVLRELRELEPMFHHPSPGTTGADLAPLLAPEFWRVGASGGVQTRSETLATLDLRFAAGPPESWTVSAEVVRRLDNRTYLYTYVLEFHGRTTRRASIWTRADTGWCATYHQATVVG